MNFIEIENEIMVSIEYNTDLFSKFTVLRMIDQLEQLFRHFIQNPSASLDSFITETVAKPSVVKKKQLIDDLEL